MDPKSSAFFSKLMLEDDGEDDLIRFTFPNEKRKIKCSISILSAVSPVFKTMFSERWNEMKPVDDAQMIDERSCYEKSIKLDDDVNFDQYLMFKLFGEILYGLRQVDSPLSVDEATAIYFYAYKYEVKDVEEKIRKFLNKRMELGMLKKPFSVAELEDSIEFAQCYHLDDFKKKLDLVKLAFDEENPPVKFYDLANKFEMVTLQQQVVDHLKTIEPKEDWIPKLICSVVKCLQNEKEELEQKLDAMSITTRKQREDFKEKLKAIAVATCSTCSLNGKFILYCSGCGHKPSVSTIIPEM